MLTDGTKQEMRVFAERITPKNWNIILNAADLRYGTGILNVLLSISDEGEEGISGRQDADPELCAGRVTGGMLFTDLKERDFDGKGKMAQAVIFVSPYFDDWRRPLVQALAQLAVYRWHAFRIRAHKKEGMVIVRPGSPEEVRHDPIFKSALSILAKRAIKECYNEIKKEKPIWDKLASETGDCRS